MVKTLTDDSIFISERLKIFIKSNAGFIIMPPPIPVEEPTVVAAKINKKHIKFILRAHFRYFYSPRIIRTISFILANLSGET